jgi:hypothetical protein
MFSLLPTSPGSLHKRANKEHVWLGESEEVERGKPYVRGDRPLEIAALLSVGLGFVELLSSSTNDVDACSVDGIYHTVGL